MQYVLIVRDFGTIRGREGRGRGRERKGREGRGGGREVQQLFIAFSSNLNSLEVLINLALSTDSVSRILSIVFEFPQFKLGCTTVYSNESFFNNTCIVLPFLINYGIFPNKATQEYATEAIAEMLTVPSIKVPRCTCIYFEFCHGIQIMKRKFVSTIYMWTKSI